MSAVRFSKWVVPLALSLGGCMFAPPLYPAATPELRHTSWRAPVLLAPQRRGEPDAPARSGQRAVDLALVQRLARERNLDVRSADARADSAASSAREAALRLVPSFTAETGLTGVSGATQSSSSGELDSADYTNAHPYLRLAYGANPVRDYFGMDAASSQADAFALGVEVSARTAVEQATFAYYDLLQAYASVPVADRALADARELVRVIEVLERQGQIRGDDRARAQADLAESEQNRIRAERSYRQASIRVAAIVDLDPEPLLVPAARDLEIGVAVTPSEPQSALTTRAFAARPEISQAGVRSEAAAAEERAAWSAVLAPSLVLYYEEGLLDDDYSDLAHRRAYGALVGWTIAPASIGAIGTAESRRAEAVLGEEKARRAIGVEVAAAREDALLAEQRLAPAERSVAAAEEALRILRVRYRNGTSILLELLQAKKAVEHARLARIAAIVDVSRARQRLALAVAP